MRGDAWRIPGRVDVAGPLLDNLGMRGAKANHACGYHTGDDRQGSAGALQPQQRWEYAHDLCDPLIAAGISRYPGISNQTGRGRCFADRLSDSATTGFGSSNNGPATRSGSVTAAGSNATAAGMRPQRTLR